MTSASTRYRHARTGSGIALALLVAACGAHCQSTARPKFDVATIKLNTSGDARRQGVSPLAGGRLRAENAPLRLMIQNAYRVRSFQISGGPGWINSDRWDIDAKAESDVNPQQTVLMLQTLLEDRFKLAFHRETKDLPVYALVPAKNGLKLEPPKEDGCAASDPAGAPPRPGTLSCGRAMIMMGSTAKLEGAKVPMAELVRILSNVLDRTIIDQTGFTGTFDVHLEFTPEGLGGLPGSGAPGVPMPETLPAPDASSASIFTVLQEKLGLKLESTKGPVEVLVIDRVEKPTEN
jgi:uncharacterized protein (TIGR03435 family)